MIVTGHWIGAKGPFTEEVRVACHESGVLDEGTICLNILCGRHCGSFIAHMSVDDAKALRDKLDEVLDPGAAKRQREAALTYAV